jgi:SET domain-containing protein
MLLVDTYIGPSDIHDIGLFAAERIKKGTPVWEYNQNTSQVFWKKQFLSVCCGPSLPAILEFIDHSYIKEGNVYYLNDRTKFINHSVDPNIAFKTSKLEIAIKNIGKGEEITENYSLSYDKNDFFFWDLAAFQGTKDTLISYLRDQLTRSVRPQNNFLIE